MNRKVRTLILVLALMAVALGLSGCAVTNGPIDLDAPPGWWEAIFVYPLARALIFLNQLFKGIGMAGSYGWAIIVFTLIIKLVTLPLTLKQLQSAKAQQVLQPQLRELQEKYGKDRQKLAEEQMKLYKEAGVNPLGGCLPMLVQLPILWALYQALYVLANPSIGELQGAAFYWIPDLSFPDLTTGMSWLPASITAGDFGKLFAYVSLPLLMTVSQFVLQKMMQPPKNGAASKGGQDSQMQMMNSMMMFMPIMFGYITLGLPSGLTLYWTASNILSLIQQYFVTGWGGLVDWIPALRGRGRELTVAVAGNPGPKMTVEPAPSGSATEADAGPAPSRPIKRRRRRR